MSRRRPHPLLAAGRPGRETPCRKARDKVRTPLDSSSWDKPSDVFDRNAEWTELTDFARSPLPGLRIAVVYGGRRQGKSYLLRRLTGAAGGLYHLATEQAEPVSLRRFGDSLAAWASLSAGAFGFGGWE
jgi:uncharacterized protein